MKQRGDPCSRGKARRARRCSRRRGQVGFSRFTASAAPAAAGLYRSAQEEEGGLMLASAGEPFLRDRLFWVRYLQAGVDFRGCASLARDGQRVSGSDLEEVRVAFAFPQGFGLTLTLYRSEHRLELIHLSLPSPALLGWMDCRQMSDLFQRDEFEVLTGHLETRADSGREPWMSRLLLGFYVSPLREDAAWYPPCSVPPWPNQGCSPPRRPNGSSRTPGPSCGGTSCGCW